jgi:uncharacterized protein YegL
MPELKAEFINTAQRLACILLIDASASMSDGGKIDQVNEGIRTFVNEVRNDEIASHHVDLAIVSFGDEVTLVHDFLCVGEWKDAPVLETNGLTPMGTAILKSLELLETRKAEYKTNKINYFRPWIFLLTDGAATDAEAMEEAVNRLAEARARRSITVFAMGIGNGVDWATLRSLTDQTFVFKFNEKRWREMFTPRSVSGGSSPQVDFVTLPSPSQWAEPIQLGMDGLSASGEEVGAVAQIPEPTWLHFGILVEDVEKTAGKAMPA